MANGDSEGSVASATTGETTPALQPKTVDRAIAALVELIGRSTTPEMLEAQQAVARRIALSGAVAPARVPPPLNVTEVGGYINLLRDAGHDAMLGRMLAAALGVADDQTAASAFEADRPPLFLADVALDRPAALGTLLASMPLSVAVRSDFATALRDSQEHLRDLGTALPVVAELPVLPAVGAAPPDDLLPFLGRSLRILDHAALRDPAGDVVVLARATGDDAFAVMLRVLDISGSGATVAEADWTALRRADDGKIEQVDLTARLIPLASALAASGFAATQVVTAAQAADLDTWAPLRNLTGLIPGRTTAGEELARLYTAERIARSGLRAVLTHRWDGSRFRN